MWDIIVSRRIKLVISGFGTECKTSYSGWLSAIEMPLPLLLSYKCKGKQATASDKTRTQAYTPAVASAVRSLTETPEAALPKKNGRLVESAFCGVLRLNMFDKKPIPIPPHQKSRTTVGQFGL
jgi:hypothetical protein